MQTQLMSHLALMRTGKTNLLYFGNIMIFVDLLILFVTVKLTAARSKIMVAQRIEMIHQTLLPFNSK